jgi:hypothetical protein
LDNSHTMAQSTIELKVFVAAPMKEGMMQRRGNWIHCVESGRGDLLAVVGKLMVCWCCDHTLAVFLLEFNSNHIRSPK